MDFLERPRGRRRRLTETVGKRRRSSYLNISLHRDSQGPCASPHFWSKRVAFCCDCSKRRRGAPRQDRGMCCVGGRDRVYRWRALTRELKRRVLRGDDVSNW